jgi:hypothetical protein
MFCGKLYFRAVNRIVKRYDWFSTQQAMWREESRSTLCWEYHCQLFTFTAYTSSPMTQWPWGKKLLKSREFLFRILNSRIQITVSAFLRYITYRWVGLVEFTSQYITYGEPGSSVSVVSGYGLGDWTIEVRFPAGAKDFSSSLCVQTGSGAHPASCTMGTGGPFHGGKARPGRDTDHSPPSSVEVENE